MNLIKSESARVFKTIRIGGRYMGDSIELVLLMNANNDFELNMARSVLEDNNIPYIIKDRGAGGHLRLIGGGMGIFNTDIYVEKASFDKAAELLESIFFNAEGEENE